MEIVKKKMTAWEDFKWDWFMIKIKWSAKLLHWKKRILWHTRCKKGWHSLSRGYMKQTNAKGKYLSVHYLHCHNCGTVYFTTKRQKNYYKRLTESRRDIMRNAFERLGEDAHEKMKKHKISPVKKGKIKVREL